MSGPGLQAAHGHIRVIKSLFHKMLFGGKGIKYVRRKSWKFGQFYG